MKVRKKNLLMSKKKWLGSDKKMMEELSKKETKEQELKEKTKKERKRILFKKWE